MHRAVGDLWKAPAVWSWRARRICDQGAGSSGVLTVEGCRDAMLFCWSWVHCTVLIMCSLSFYKLQIRINCFMESLCKM